jgi:bacterioferritin
MAKKDVLAILDEIRRAELTASIQYMAHHSELESLGIEKLAKMTKEEAIEEMKHAEILAERIFFLGGRPTHTPLKDAHSSPDLMEMLKADAALEVEAIDRLNGAISLCLEERDSGTRLLLERILTEEEEHLEKIRGILEMIERVGGQGGYLMCICGSGVPPGTMGG